MGFRFKVWGLGSKLFKEGYIWEYISEYGRGY